MKLLLSIVLCLPSQSSCKYSTELSDDLDSVAVDARMVTGATHSVFNPRFFFKKPKYCYEVAELGYIFSVAVSRCRRYKITMPRMQLLSSRFLN